MRTKKCARCEEIKEVIDFYFKKTENRINSWCKSCIYESQNNRRKSLKQRAINLMGGKCHECDYDKNLAALDFHHLDPSEKEYGWSKLRRHTWKEIVKEIKKCIVVCSNCHREIHNPKYNITDIDKPSSLLEKDRIRCIKPTGICPTCNEEVYGTKFCSVKCSSLSKRKIIKRPSNKQLLKEIEETSYCAVGRKYGVSDNAVRKWLK